MTTPALVTTGLTKIYRPFLGRATPSLLDLDLELPRGSVFGLLGPNGAGKTTTILMVLGLVRPSRGAYSLFGARMGDARARARVGYLPEKFQLPSFLTATEFLGFHGRLQGLGGKDLAARIPTWLGKVGLRERAHERVGTFSKGMQQRLALAQALLHEPDLVVLDEPTSALDPVGRMEVRALIEELKARGAAVLLNSHILSDVERVCDRVAILRRGRLERVGSMSDLTGGSLRLQVRLAGYTPELEARLRGLARDLRLVTPGEVTELELALEGEEAIPPLAAAVLETGARLYALTPMREGLEELFMRVVKEEA